MYCSIAFRFKLFHSPIPFFPFHSFGTTAFFFLFRNTNTIPSRVPRVSLLLDIFVYQTLSCIFFYLNNLRRLSSVFTIYILRTRIFLSVHIEYSDDVYRYTHTHAYIYVYMFISMVSAVAMCLHACFSLFFFPFWGMRGVSVCDSFASSEWWRRYEDARAFEPLG